tara:strand:- start:2626 stop:3690 length:1065 start_codon:yes stop_codon:yes gene_type:complete
MNEIIADRVRNIEKKVGKNQLYPLNIVPPRRLILDRIPEKRKLLGTIIPGAQETYVFTEQEPYYKDYQESYFGYNWKKGQWDTGRNQEIMMNGCVPLFMDIDKCPEYCLMHHPKEKYESIRNRYAGKSLGYINNFDGDEYEQDCLWLMDYCRENLNSEAMAKFSLSVTQNEKVKNVLFITLGDRADQLNDYMFIGFRNLLGSGVVETNKLWWVYKDVNEGYTYRGTNDDRVQINPNDPNLSKKDRDGLVKNKVKVTELRGGGFTYSGHLDDVDVDRENIEDKIRDKYYDLIVYGSFNRCKDHLDLVLDNYEKDNIFFFDVDDDVVNKKIRPDTYEKYKSKGIYFCPDLRVMLND